MIWPPGELWLSCSVLEPPVSNTGALLKAPPALCCSSSPPFSFQPLPAVCIPPFIAFGSIVIGGAVYIYFFLFLIIFWRPLDVVSHCIGGGLAKMMGDISCLSQRDGLCRARACFSHSVMLCLGMCRGSLMMGRRECSP